MEIKHIYWFSYFNLDEPSVRYRAKFPLQHLAEKHGITYSFVYPGYDFHNMRRFILVFLAALLFRRKNSVIVFQKIFTNGFYANALKLLLYFRPSNTVYDIDDAEYTRRPSGTMHHFMKECSACSVGSKSLFDYTKQFNNNVFFLTSPVIDHGITKEESTEPFTVGWIGYYGAHRQSLTTLFFPALQHIDFPLKLVLLGVANHEQASEIRSYFSANKNIKVETPMGLDWHDELAIYRIIATFDVGVSPLIDTEFNRAKSAFKLKQCLSCGVPVLGSSVGENAEFLQHGINGYICDCPDDYLQNLRLIRSSQQNRYPELSMNAKATFPRFSVALYSAEFLQYFRNRKATQ